MRFLLDQNQSPRLVELLADLGHDAIHVRQIGMSRASDTEIMAIARDDNRVVVSGDTDFGELLARTNAASPSLVLFRRQGLRRAAELAALLDANLAAVVDDFDAGAVVVLTRTACEFDGFLYNQPNVSWGSGPITDVWSPWGNAIEWCA